MMPHFVLLLELLDLSLEFEALGVLAFLDLLDLPSHNIDFLRTANGGNLCQHEDYRDEEATNCAYRTSREIFMSSISSFFSRISVSFSSMR